MSLYKSVATVSYQSFIYRWPHNFETIRSYDAGHLIFWRLVQDIEDVPIAEASLVLIHATYMTLIHVTSVYSPVRKTVTFVFVGLGIKLVAPDLLFNVLTTEPLICMLEEIY